MRREGACERRGSIWEGRECSREGEEGRGMGWGVGIKITIGSVYTKQCNQSFSY